MAAPDVDRREFERLWEAFGRSAERMTLYAADNDRALGASDTLHGAPRVGGARPMFLQRGTESIDASAIVKGFLRHAYFADPRVLGDITRVLNGETKMPRFGMIGMPTDRQPAYWSLQP